MRHLPNANQMKEADAETIISKGITSLELMETAALAITGHIEDLSPDMSLVCVVCGTGNNGGDGLAIARILKEKGYNVFCVLIGDKHNRTPETAAQLEKAKESDVKLLSGLAPVDSFIGESEISLVIDALFGIGLSREVTGEYAAAIDWINSLKCPAISVDVPSGICATTGQILAKAVEADVTITVGACKCGLLLSPARKVCGDIRVARIGIDEAIFASDKETAFSIDEGEYKYLLPVRPEDSHKGTFGNVLLVAGSSGMAGAAYLSALAAYRTGAGLVTIFTPKENRVILQSLLPEAIIKPMGEYPDEEIKELVSKASVVCFGPGLGTAEPAEKLLRETLISAKCPVVLDADGINLLAKRRWLLPIIKGKDIIITPHIGEMARLLQIDPKEIARNRIEEACDYAQSAGVTCILKDDRTIVAALGKKPYINLSGCAAMAKAGSGDVLSGIVSGLLAQNCPVWESTILATYIHGLAGEAASEKYGEYSVLARNIADEVGTAIKKIER
ncbi:MAG: NAD(P)H-hydrate dehydratase [Lachnospiraceae bacterium]|jgi:NAD(P)H-hydrate epimerase|nr:NAD(P)H-hydrate dehydratase [Lachnospiraceae bacterium]